jgi:hypothetical protein
MNTRDDWLTTATIHDEHRAALWGSIFPGARVPIKSIIPGTADLPEHKGARVYLLDLDAISDEQRDRLIKSIADLFSLPIDEVVQDMMECGVPILAEDVSVESCDRAMIINLMDGFDETGRSLPCPDLEDEDPSLPGYDEWNDTCDCDLCLATRDEEDD